MSSIDLQLQSFSGVPITHGTLLTLLRDYRTPNNKISRWLSSGMLLPLKKGLYLVSPEISGVNCPLPLIANALYGPSYVSLDYALFEHGLIPEQVFSITSVTTLRSKDFENNFGWFTYAHIPSDLFAIGVNQVVATDKASYLLASPTKALCDKLVLSRNLRIYSQRAFNDFLLNDLRIDGAELGILELPVIEACLACKHKTGLLRYLFNLVEELK
jgi:hypothetical protein